MKPIKVYACLFPVDFIFPVGKVTFALELRFCAFRHTHVLLLYILKKNSWREKMRCFLSPFHSRRPRVEICEWSSSLAWPKKHFLQSSTFFAKMIIRLLLSSKKTVLTYIIFCTHLWIGSGTVFANHAKKSTYPWNYCPSDFEAKKSWDDCLTWNKIEFKKNR